MLHAGIALALGAAAVAACGDGENRDPNGGAPGGAGGSLGGTGGVPTAAGGAGAVESGGGGVAGANGGDGGVTAAAGHGGLTPRGGRGGTPSTAGDAGETGAGQGGKAEPKPPKPPSCDEPTGKLPKLELSAFASVNEPVQAVAPPGDPRLFVVSRAGGIYVVKSRNKVLDAPFLTLAVDRHYSELGLLGLAFHPRYAENGLFYVHHIAPIVGDQDTGDLLVEEYQRDPDDADRALPKPRRELIRIPQPSHKHKAGTMAFDSEGLLYIAIGNGGEQPISHDNTQLRGKVLRIAPSPDTESYAIPRTNPLLAGWAPEILETGLRNPWRIALDPCTDDLYIADVGNANAEEINVVRAGDHGHDFGFPAYEGATRTCNGCEVSGEEVPPTVEYAHDAGCAVIGGVVYRGSAIPALRGSYLYSDLCSGTFHAFRFEGSGVTDELDLTHDLNPNKINQISSFGTDASGEVYVMSLSKNRVYRIDPE